MLQNGGLGAERPTVDRPSEIDDVRHAGIGVEDQASPFDLHRRGEVRVARLAVDPRARHCFDPGRQDIDDLVGARGRSRGKGRVERDSEEIAAPRVRPSHAEAGLRLARVEPQRSVVHKREPDTATRASE